MAHLHGRLCQASSPTTWRASLLRPVGIYIGQLKEELDPRMAPWGGDQCVRIDFNEHIAKSLPEFSTTVCSSLVRYLFFFAEYPVACYEDEGEEKPP